MRQSLMNRVRGAIAALRGKSVQSYARSLVGMSDRIAPWRDDPHEQVRHHRHWVYVAVRAIASRVAGTPLDFYRIDTGERLDATHPIRRLMREVNPFDTAVSLWMKTMTFLELTGNAYWYAPRNAFGAVSELWILPSQYMRVLPDRNRFVKGYLFRNGAVEETFSADEVIHLKYPSPESPFYGAGPLQAAADAVDAHEAMKLAERRTFENGVFPGLAVQTADKLSADVRKRLEESLKQGFGGPDRAGRALILEQGLTVRPFTYSPREMDFLESARITRDEILSVFGVPAAVAGVSEDVNRASAEAMLWTFAENTILPKLRLLDAQLTQDLCARFDPRIEARFGSPLPEARADDRADMQARITCGITTVNEERARLGLSPLPGCDRPAPASTPTVSDGSEQADDPQSTADDGSDAADQRDETASNETDDESDDESDSCASRVRDGVDDADNENDDNTDDDPGDLEESVRAFQSALMGQSRRIIGTMPQSKEDLAARIARVLDDPREPDRLIAPLYPALARAGMAKSRARQTAERAAAQSLMQARGLLMPTAPGQSAAGVRAIYAETLVPDARRLLHRA